ncbi:hypothetical protein P0Y35_08670 [Kiritimatiellaeota bacterium B1221]|nr:hypothetical protein [Kiritimatiellaeota bacterium B1221]
MKAVDYRNETFDQVKGRMDSTRKEIWAKMQEAARAMTTREIADFTGIDLLTVRPRITELCQIGFVEVEGNPGREGKYRAVSEWVALRKFEKEVRIAREPQMELPL